MCKQKIVKCYQQSFFRASISKRGLPKNFDTEPTQNKLWVWRILAANQMSTCHLYRVQFSAGLLNRQSRQLPICPVPFRGTQECVLFSVSAPKKTTGPREFDCLGASISFNSTLIQLIPPEGYPLQRTFATCFLHQSATDSTFATSVLFTDEAYFTAVRPAMTSVGISNTCCIQIFQ
ncbi:hypothetical protein TNCV_2692681 [Trichonephila clavipes]|uniref:Uncharacterized protein n=1 Tax=Trichonephila clavipes TaxID=2585209 RepID=A0A8X6VZ48_TRICX|nr:hypothetical protein TNCV_2692681 [Trichonephila clavipes]